jgi:serine/threonine protein kinase
VEFIGAYISEDNKPSIVRLSYFHILLLKVMEYCSNGSLYDVMNDKKVTFTWERALFWMYQMVNGIAALHNFTKPLVHRDIKSLNLLLDDEWNIKVCDFGLSRFRTMTHLQSLGELRGTMAYCAPCVSMRLKL